MTSNEQRIAIATACGWTRIRNGTGYRTADDAKHGQYQIIPEYCVDLNAMHEAEKVLIDHPTDKPASSRADDSAVVRYSHWLRKIVGIELRGEEVLSSVKKPDGERLVLFTHVFPSPWSYFEFTHATAAQRCEAFLRTLNLYQPHPEPELVKERIER